MGKRSGDRFSILGLHRDARARRVLCGVSQLWSEIAYRSVFD